LSSEKFKLGRSKALIPLIDTEGYLRGLETEMKNLKSITEEISN